MSGVDRSCEGGDYGDGEGAGCLGRADGMMWEKGIGQSLGKRLRWNNIKKLKNLEGRLINR